MYGLMDELLTCVLPGVSMHGLTYESLTSVLLGVTMHGKLINVNETCVSWCVNVYDLSQPLVKMHAMEK